MIHLLYIKKKKKFNENFDLKITMKILKLLYIVNIFDSKSITILLINKIISISNSEKWLQYFSKWSAHYQYIVNKIDSVWKT